MRPYFQLVFLLIFCSVIQVHAQAECSDGEWMIDGECVLANETLDSGWHTILPAGETRCAHDTDFQFWVRPGNEHIVLYFQGGGGCWNQDTCRSGSSFYKQAARTNEPVSYRNGIFDFDNPDNPFAESTFIFAPSCTGDVYMGSGVTDYGDDVIVHHKGFDNLMSAVDFTVDYMPDPKSVFVTGCSAGSVGSAIAIPFIIEAYPDATVTHLGDSLGTIFDTPTDLTQLWGVPNFYTDTLAKTAPDLSKFTTTDYYIGLGEGYPTHTFAQFNFRFDNVQQRYFAAGIEDPAAFIAFSLGESLIAIADEIVNFHYFLADSTQHCILPRVDLYRVEVDGVSALDWITSISRGESVDNYSP
jgi:hypothetical protein